MNPFRFWLIIDIAVLFLFLWSILYGKRFELANVGLGIIAATLAIAVFLILKGKSLQWLWLSGIWVLGLGIPYVAGFMLRERIPSFKNLWDGCL